MADLKVQDVDRTDVDLCCIVMRRCACERALYMCTCVHQGVHKGRSDSTWRVSIGSGNMPFPGRSSRCVSRWRYLARVIRAGVVHDGGLVPYLSRCGA